MTLPGYCIVAAKRHVEDWVREMDENTRRTPGPGYAGRLQHADDLGPPSHNLTVGLQPVQVRMQQRLERAPITLDDRDMRD